MGQNLTGKLIKNTYEDLVQISGSILTDGTGSDITNLTVTASNAISSSYAVTASYAENATLVPDALYTASISDATITFTKGDASTFDITVNNVVNADSASHVDTLVSASWVQDTDTVTFDYGDGNSAAFTVNNVNNAVSASYAVTASYAVSSSADNITLQDVLDNGNTATQDIILTGDINATNITASGADIDNIIVGTISGSTALFTSASIGYLTAVTGSIVKVGDAFILLNTSDVTRYAGLLVEDSGSSTPINYTASFFFDSVTNDWNYEYTSGSTDYGVALFGPTYNTKGAPTYLTANTLPKAEGTHHLVDSIISDDGSVVTVAGDIEATAITASAGFSGDLEGTASFASTASVVVTNPASDNVSYNLTFVGNYGGPDIQEVRTDDNGNITFNPTTGTLTVPLVSGNATTATTASYAATALSSSYAVTASYALNAGGGGFPYTGSAIITGSLAVTGSQYGLLNGRESIEIFYTSSVSTQVPSVMIAAFKNRADMNVVPNPIGTVVIGPSETTTAAKGIRSGSGNFNAVIAGGSNVINRGQYNTILGGASNNIEASGSTQVNASTQYNIIAGGQNNELQSRGSYNAIMGGSFLTIKEGTDTTPSYNALVGGQSSNISSSDHSAILAGRSHKIQDMDFSAILGGEANIISSSDSTSGWNAIVGGKSNTILSHDYSAIIGGQGLRTTQDYEVVVPNLTISASSFELTPVLTFADGTTMSTAPTASVPFPYTGSAVISGSLRVLVSGSADGYTITSGSLTGSLIDNLGTPTGSDAIKHLVYLSQAEYNAITPDDNTMYVISGSGDIVDDLVVSGSFEVSGSTVFTGSVLGNVSALSISSNTASMDLSTGNFFTLQLVSGSNTYINPTNIQAGQTVNLLISTTGSATVSFPSLVKQVSGSSYVPTTTTSKDVVTFITFDTGSIYLSNVKNLV